MQTPTLVIHPKGFRVITVEHARYLADHLPDARLLLVDGDSPMPFIEPMEESLLEVEAFVTGTRSRATTTGRVLATVLFTDIVGSTSGPQPTAIGAGAHSWRVTTRARRGVVEQSGGRVVKLTGDGVSRDL